MRYFIPIALLVATGIAQAAGPQFTMVSREAQVLNLNLETCVIQVRTLYVDLRAGRQSQDIDPEKCASDGKAAVKDAYDKIRAGFGGKAPVELADWRLEWMAAFDASRPEAGEIERTYLQRQSQSKQNISRASNKLEMTFE